MGRVGQSLGEGAGTLSQPCDSRSSTSAPLAAVTTLHEGRYDWSVDLYSRRVSDE